MVYAVPRIEEDQVLSYTKQKSKYNSAYFSIYGLDRRPEDKKI